MKREEESCILDAGELTSARFRQLPELALYLFTHSACAKVSKICFEIQEISYLGERKEKREEEERKRKNREGEFDEVPLELSRVVFRFDLAKRKSLKTGDFRPLRNGLEDSYFLS